MPIYEYQCEKCEHQFDTLQKLSEKPLKKCPECGKMALNKLVSAAGFRLKGGGWYETDFKSGGNKKNLANSESSSSEGSDKGSSSDKSSGDSKGTADSGAAAKKSKGDSAKQSKSPAKD